MFVQVIRGRVADPEAVREAFERWVRELSPGADGWLGSTGGVTADGRLVVLARFASAEAAQANSRRPEQDRWWQDTAALVSEPTFHDSADVRGYLATGSDKAGFVQVITGQTTDPDKMMDSVVRLSASLHAFRPDLIGGTVALHHDGTFTEAVYFTSVEQARAGEQRQLPPELQGALDRAEELTSMLSYHDLTDPWLLSPPR
ncbi:hypothetical protein [Catellatospora citrea]|uniref:Antibiotic biosynthesis monooxygenase n=1 Tax=Catellatospora citrea TaxID=53366 RepID=A0A8J3P378_9ACTN|nr:hypothetical protein [Catellatospora citrea]RKE11596.1 hypothetical protein C8E86_6525 [Catellatospora citrea]GIG02401.1 hypothetical protein Cci01nite_74940 [Catellatospora citrea]